MTAEPDLTKENVHLRRVAVAAPAALVIRADHYLSDLLREAGLLRAAPGTGQTRGLLLAIDALLARHEHVRVALRRQAEAALGAHATNVELVLELPVDAAAAIRRFLDVYLRLTELAENERLLTLPPPPDVAAFQERWARAVIAQLEDGAPGGTRTRRRRARPRLGTSARRNSGPRGSSPRLRVRLRPTPAAALQARRLLQATCDQALCEMAELPLSEVVTNAVLHARTDVEVTLHVADGALRAEVRDGVRDLALVPARDPDASFGRGLALVEALVDRWGVSSDTAGKIVWFEVGQPAQA